MSIPSLIIWVISIPVIAFTILYKNRNRLEEESIKKYYLILYQGLTREVFYWEFVNTLRKVIVLALNTILSILLITYRLLICIILLVTVERLQNKLKPYKLEENNDIEIKAIIAGTTIIFSGLLFEEGAEYNYSGFDAMAFIVILVYNSMFLLQWTYLLLYSISFKNEKIRKVIDIYRCLICTRRVRRYTAEVEDEYNS